jgi:hypothetical protein
MTEGSRVHIPGELELALGCGERVRFTFVTSNWLAEQSKRGETPLSQSGVLGALRVRIENCGARRLVDGAGTFRVETMQGDDIEADLLVDVSAIAPGATTEGWLVFEVRRDDEPRIVRYADRRGATAEWALGSS